MSKKGQTPVYFEFSPEQIESMPEDLRLELGLDLPAREPTITDLVCDFITNIKESNKPDAEFNVKDVQYFLFTVRGEVVNQATVRSALKKFLDRPLKSGGIYRLKDRRYFTFKAAK